MNPYEELANAIILQAVKDYRLTDDERISAIAAMLSGDNITEAALQNARELMGK